MRMAVNRFAVLLIFYCCVRIGITECNNCTGQVDIDNSYNNFKIFILRSREAVLICRVARRVVMDRIKVL